MSTREPGGLPSAEMSGNSESTVVGAEVCGESLRLSVVLALHGQRALTEACLLTLRAEMPEAEVVCVDNASPDDTLGWLKAQSGIQVVALPENRGVPAAWNLGLRLATGNVLCVLNNDVCLQPGGLRSLAQAAVEQGIAAFAGGVLDQHLRFLRFTEDPAESHYPDGCALAFRRDVYALVGPFDEGMGIGYYEDADWGLRARSMGFSWAILPHILIHLGGQTSRQFGDLAEVKARNHTRLSARWGTLAEAGHVKDGVCSEERWTPSASPRNEWKDESGFLPYAEPVGPLVEEVAGAVLERVEFYHRTEALADAVLARLAQLSGRALPPEQSSSRADPGEPCLGAEAIRVLVERALSVGSPPLQPSEQAETEHPDEPLRLSS